MFIIFLVCVQVYVSLFVYEIVCYLCLFVRTYERERECVCVRESEREDLRVCFI